MPTYQVTAPNGRVYQVDGPEGATDEQVHAEVMRQFPEAAGTPSAPAPTDNSAVRGFILGAEKPLDNLSVAASHIPVVGPAIDNLSQAMGMPTAAQSAAQHQAARANNSRTGYQTIGNIFGTLPTAELKGGMAVQGAASGALLSDADTPGGVIRDSTVGALTSLGIGKGLQTLGSLATPLKNKAAVALHNAGIDLSPGQLWESTGSEIGKAVRKIEDKARSAPIIGSFISAGRDRATTQFNQYLANQALGSIGKTVPAKIPVGHDLIDYASSQLSNEYQKVVPNLVGRFDKKFGADLAQAKAVTNVLPGDKQDQFRNIVEDVLWNRSSGAGSAKTMLSGQNLKDAETKLGELIRGYSRSPDHDQRVLSQALSGVQDALRTMAVRSNPQSGAQLQAINQGWARLAQMKKAANVNGVVLPTAYARVANKTGFDLPVARGAAQLLPDHVPNSGTADRVAMLRAAEMMLGGGGGASFLTHSSIPLGVGAGTFAAGTLGSLPYTKLGTKMINSAAFAKRPQVVQQAGRLIDLLSHGTPIVVPPLLAARRRPQP